MCRLLDRGIDELSVPCSAQDNFGECPSQQKTVLEDCLKERDKRKENRSQGEVRAVEEPPWEGEGNLQPPKSSTEALLVQGTPHPTQHGHLCSSLSFPSSLSSLFPFEDFLVHLHS